jgi:hypothetical protein
MHDVTMLRGPRDGTRRECQRNRRAPRQSGSRVRSSRAASAIAQVSAAQFVIALTTTRELATVGADSRTANGARARHSCRAASTPVCRIGDSIRVRRADDAITGRASTDWRVAACPPTRSCALQAVGTAVTVGRAMPSSSHRRRVGERAWGARRASARAGPEVGDDLVDHRRLGDERDNAHRAVAGRARQWVHLEDLLEEGCRPACAHRRVAA